MATNSIFFNSSKETANKYIQNILFVDDEVFSSVNNMHSLDGLELTNIFAKENKLCVLNVPKKMEDLNNTFELAKKSDVIVLDWKIHLELEENNDNASDEQDVVEDDVRGYFTLNLIDKILEEQPNSLKLIMVYTGENTLENIVDTIFSRFESKGIERVIDKHNTLSNNNIKIIVHGKPSLIHMLNHVPHLRAWVVEYKDLPSVILSAFTQMTTGLISNVILEAITCIRNNSSKLLSIYDKKMDAAFLSHRALLPVMDDASELLKESIINSIRAIFDYEEVSSKCDINYIVNWIDGNSFKEELCNIYKENILISKDLLKQWQQDGFQKTLFDALKKQKVGNNTDMNQVQQIEDAINKKVFSFYREKLHKESLNYFLPTDINAVGLDESFSILTHHKSNYASIAHVPKLGLGSVIKGVVTNKYWICIQQKCDSVRIPVDEERRFLFLPLEVVEENKKFIFIVLDDNNYIRLQIVSGTYDIRTIKFKSNNNGCVGATKRNDNYYFSPIYLSDPKPENYNPKVDEEFLWVMDLKDAHAQRIANKFASQLCRVGLDESEWLRRHGESD